MPTYSHICNHCNEEFELEYGMKEDPPTDCPLCLEKNCVKRQISWAAGRVELTGQDFQNKIKEDTRALKKDYNRNENLMANLIGEDKYNSRR